MNIQRAIAYLCPGSSYYFHGDVGYQYLIWQDTSTTKPLEEDLIAADLAAAISERIIRAKVEARERIYAQYPAYAQTNLLFGFYDSLPDTDPFYPANMKNGIQSIIMAERAAEASINNLTTADAVDSFTW